jgi:hypothetical protein
MLRILKENILAEEWRQVCQIVFYRYRLRAIQGEMGSPGVQNNGVVEGLEAAGALAVHDHFEAALDQDRLADPFGPQIVAQRLARMDQFVAPLQFQVRDRQIAPQKGLLFLKMADVERQRHKTSELEGSGLAGAPSEFPAKGGLDVGRNEGIDVAAQGGDFLDKARA